MADPKLPTFEFGGVDARSNPANFPRDRSLRCLNFMPQPSGLLQLRYGFSLPTMGTIDGAHAIHSAAYYEQINAGVVTQFVIYGQSTAMKSLALATGTVTNLQTLSNANPWGHFRARNSIFIANGTDFFQFDGTTVRPVGIRAPNSTEASGVGASFGADVNGSWSTTSLAGYQIWMAYYNPNTGHVGNCVQVASVLQNATNTTVALSLTGLPNLSGVNTEWLKIFGRTFDSGQIPYWLVNAGGTRLSVGNTNTTATFELGNVDYTAQLPTRNSVPPTNPGLHYFSKINTRVFAIDDTNLGFWYCEDLSDPTPGPYVGNSEESWPADNFQSSPTGEKPTGIHGSRFETWLFSKNWLSIWNTLLQQAGTNPWRGPWPTSLCGQRGYVETPYGPYWMTFDKQLTTWDGAAPIPASEEYEASLLAQIDNGHVALTELMYHRDPEQMVDAVYILGFDSGGNPKVIVHDFKLRDARSPFGQGYQSTYGGDAINTFVGSGYSPRQNARDTNQRSRLWAGLAGNSTLYSGRFVQLEDGSTADGTVTYSGDYVGLLPMGPAFVAPQALQIQGDGNVQVSYTTIPSTPFGSYEAAAVDQIDTENTVYEFTILSEVSRPRWLYLRMQLTSHPADGNFAITNPPYTPMPTYGRINEAILREGTGQPLSR